MTTPRGCTGWNAPRETGRPQAPWPGKRATALVTARHPERAPVLWRREGSSGIDDDTHSGDGGSFGRGRAAARNLIFNDPAEQASAFAKAERAEAKGGMGDVQTVRHEGKKVGRNDPCPCGSGKKYKKCHGA